MGRDGRWWGEGIQSCGGEGLWKMGGAGKKENRKKT